MRTPFLMLSLIASDVTGAEPQRLEESVMDTPAREYIEVTHQKMALPQNEPVSLEEAAARILEVVPSQFRDDIRAAARSGSRRGCDSSVKDLPGRVHAAIFSEVFWRVIETGNVAKAIGKSAGDQTSLLFSEFKEKYLNEFAIAWGMREHGSKLYRACESYGVKSVTPCLEALMVYQASRATTCPLRLRDELFLYIAQPQPAPEG